MLKGRGDGREERERERVRLKGWGGGRGERYVGKESRVERRAELFQPLLQGQRLGQPRRVCSPVEEHEAKEEVLF